MSEAGEAVVKLRIENRYEGAGMVVTEVVTRVPLPIPAEGSDERFDWADANIFDHTGTGREQGDAWYDVEIVESDAPELVGLTFEFGY